jgi:hypothetical protein
VDNDIPAVRKLRMEVVIVPWVVLTTLLVIVDSGAVRFAALIFTGLRYASLSSGLASKNAGVSRVRVSAFTTEPSTVADIITISRLARACEKDFFLASL